MKVKELIEKLQQFDPEMEVGGSGHFGELLEIYDVNLSEQDEATYVDGNFIQLPKWVRLYIQYAGSEPD